MKRVTKRIETWDGKSDCNVQPMIIVSCEDLFNKYNLIFDQAVELLLRENAEFREIFEENDAGDIQLKCEI
jgi:hypothetical protein